MAKTIEQAELTELEQLTLAGLQPSSCQLVGSLPPTLFSSTGSFSEAASGMSSSSSQLKKTPETGESLPKTPTLYGHLSETLRSTASYLEETLGFSTPSSSAVTPSLEDEQQPQA